MSDKPAGSTLNVREASSVLNVHEKTILELINSGALPAAKIGRAYVMIYKDVMNFLEKMVVRQTSERMGARPRLRSIT